MLVFRHGIVPRSRVVLIGYDASARVPCRPLPDLFAADDVEGLFEPSQKTERTVILPHKGYGNTRALKFSHICAETPHIIVGEGADEARVQENDQDDTRRGYEQGMPFLSNKIIDGGENQTCSDEGEAAIWSL